MQDCVLKCARDTRDRTLKKKKRKKKEIDWII